MVGGISVEAVLEALAYCQDHWEMISTERDEERTWLDQQGFFAEAPPTLS